MQHRGLLLSAINKGKVEHQPNMAHFRAFNMLQASRAIVDNNSRPADNKVSVLLNFNLRTSTST